MKRIPRKMPKEHKNLDVMKPLFFEKLGSSDDPCFGNYSAKDEACKRCGDSEICAAVSSAKMLNEIKQIEATQPMKDVDEGNLVDTQNKSAGLYMLTKVTKKPDQWFSISKLLPKFIEAFNLTSRDEPVLTQRLIKAGRETGKIKFNKQLTKYKSK